MAYPQSLPEQLFLLACKPERRRLTARGELGYVLRAAALVELQLSGYLDDQDGYVWIRGRTTLDPLLNGILDEIGTTRPRRWRYWIGRHARRAVPAVRDRLVAVRAIEVQPRWLLPPRITVPDPLLRERVVAAVQTALTGMVPPSAHDAALVALAAAADLPQLLRRGQRWTHRQRIKELTERTGPVPKALRQLVHARRSSGGG